MNNDFKTKHKLYQKIMGLSIPYETFMKPKRLVEFHEGNVGTVIKKFKKDLTVYAHIFHFGCMFFSMKLTDNQIANGPVLYMTTTGTACCL